MNQSLSSTALIFPFELLLPILGLLLIRSSSPINSLIYRSFLGSIAALIYALVGAPDVALTEVMVGTLLSSLLYIVTIRSCYSVVVIVDKNEPPSSLNKSYLKSIFDTLHLSVVYQDEIFTNDKDQNLKFLDSSKLSGSPHALLIKNTFYIEADSLLIDIQRIAKDNSLSGDLTFSKISN
tara:strand:+ start:3470 stop:4009 length:540 start_codon:yes stop_codon:yes gene_type:complete